MDGYLKQSTSAVVQIGPFVDKDDGITAETGMSITQVKIFISKAGAAFATISTANIATHDMDGFYRKTLGVADTGTVGTVKLQVSEVTTALPVWHDFIVLPANVYDSLVAGTDYIQGDIIQIEGADATAQITSLVSAETVDIESLLGAPTTSIEAHLVDIQSIADAITVSGVISLIGAPTTTLNAGIVDILSVTGAIDNADVISLIGAPTTSIEAHLDDIQSIADALPSATEIQTEMEENGASILDTLQDRLTAARAGYIDNLSGHTAQTGDNYAKLIHSLYGLSMIEAYVDEAETKADGITSLLGAPAGSTVSADVADIRDKMHTGIEKNKVFSNLEFLMVDSSDHRTGKTGLSITGYRSVDGNAFSALGASIASVGSGIYQADLTAADTNGTVITYRFTASGADDTFVTIKTST